MKKYMKWVVGFVVFAYTIVNVNLLLAVSAMSSISDSLDKTLAAVGNTVPIATNISQTVQVEAEVQTSRINTDVVFHHGSPKGLAIHKDGSLLIADSYNKVVWNLTNGEKPTINTGRLELKDINGIPIGGYNDSTLLESAYLSPHGISPFLDGYVLSDTDNNVIRFFNDEKVFTAVGSGSVGYKDGFGTDVEFSAPTGVASDDSGNIYIADTGNHIIRVLNKSGNVSTFAGSAEGCATGALTDAAFRLPSGLCWNNGALYVADSGNHRICKIENGIVTVVTGSANTSRESDESFAHGGFFDGSVDEALFSNPQGIVVSESGDIYVADTGNGAIRKIRGDKVTTMKIAGKDKNITYPVSPVSLLIDDDTLYASDEFFGVVFKLKIA